VELPPVKIAVDKLIEPPPEEKFLIFSSATVKRFSCELDNKLNCHNIVSFILILGIRQFLFIPS
jgi:hypothetical protein